MSKMDDMRAMREARFGQAPPRPIRAPRAPVAPTVAPRPPRPPVVDGPAEPEERLCGHRAISGRTCTREHGHDAKSHRYS